MGSYADYADVTGRYPTMGKQMDDTEMQESFIAGIEAYMNGYLAKLFTVPVAGKPPLLTDIAIDLAYCRANFRKEKGIDKLQADALARLNTVMNFEVLLMDSDNVYIESVGAAVWSTEMNYESTFSMLGPLDDRIDLDRLEDLRDDRN